MNRLNLVGLIATTVVVAACGSAANAANTASPSPSGGPGAAFRNGASGQLVQINGQTLIITGPNGDTVVSYSATTPITKTSIAALADITVGTCIVATGQKVATGAVTATSVRLAPKPATGCPTGTGLGPNPGAESTPRPSASPRPTPSGFANRTIIAGEVTGVSGTSVTVLTTTSGSQTVTVPSAATITRSFTVSASALQTGECVRAAGQKDASGNVQATSLTITPAGPSGTCNSGFGGRGGFGGGAAPPAAGA